MAERVASRWHRTRGQPPHPDSWWSVTVARISGSPGELTKLPIMSGDPADLKAGTFLSMVHITDREISAPMKAQKPRATFPRCGRERLWRSRRRWTLLGRSLVGGGIKKGLMYWSKLTCH